MEVSGQLHMLAPLCPRKEPLPTTGVEVGFAPELFWMWWSQLLLGIKP